ncbi:MAG: DUF434 domain-containing protein [Hadesarchaea archaeon]|nr:DUF434 domain-containing protein [Hadesarchaea archaeon]
MFSRELKCAVKDLRYLLNQGYPRESAVNFVSNHYRLPLSQRHLLARCVFSDAEAAVSRAKAVDMTGVQGKTLGVDGYNVLITVESILTGKPIIMCDDGYVRDLRAIFGKYRKSSATPKALEIVIATIAEARPSEVQVMFDGQVSRSGELAAEVRRLLGKAGLEGSARAVKGVDFWLHEFDVAASSDRAVIERAGAIWDIPAEVLRRRKARVIDLTVV